ncbi:PRC-barrel domain-containing protein [Tropicimonas sp. IMCC34011]|uniref:PRC-barrel domain-containing protein n=1 Tax=Tropicimonas sp. IMCC34011 TaxID=2248759 RepID=UPI000E237DAA|nr:PRC-barrel domain-containing protein [Tropicimonas sp. IMCC34011]
MRKLLASTALLAIGATPLLAQTDTTATQTAGEDSVFLADATPGQMLASRLMGMRVYTSEADLGDATFADADQDWDDIGEVGDVILSQDGSTEAIILDIGGFLGIGERNVAVSLDQIQFVADDNDPGDYFLVVNATQDQLENAPQFDLAQMNGTAAMTAGDDAELAATDAPEAGLEMDAAEMDAETQPSEGEVAEGGELVTESEAGATDQADLATDTDTETLANGGMAPTATEPGMVGDGLATGEGFSREGYQMVDATAMTAEELDGVRVYGTDDSWIGEVSDILLSQEGSIESVIVDVGGFLGIGEKPVQLSFEDLNLQRQENGNQLRAYVGATEEELEALPRFEQ